MFAITIGLKFNALSWEHCLFTQPNRHADMYTAYLTQVIASFLNAVAVALANSANEVKAEDIRVLYVKPLVYWTRYFIIATAFSNPQINAIA